MIFPFHLGSFNRLFNENKKIRKIFYIILYFFNSIISGVLKHFKVEQELTGHGGL